MRGGGVRVAPSSSDPEYSNASLEAASSSSSLQAASTSTSSTSTPAGAISEDVVSAQGGGRGVKAASLLKGKGGAGNGALVAASKSFLEDRRKNGEENHGAQTPAWTRAAWQAAGAHARAEKANNAGAKMRTARIWRRWAHTNLGGRLRMRHRNLLRSRTLLVSR